MLRCILGPRLFLSCPTDPSSFQVWFTDLWNYSIVPYLLEAIKEGVQVCGIYIAVLCKLCSTLPLFLFRVLYSC